MRLFEVFWWSSALSRMDTRDAQANVWTRHITGLAPSVPPEEVTTFNLVRRLVDRRAHSGGLALALHSRPLEGGNRRTGRRASGADLELAVEVAPHHWVDIVLQAKRFDPRTGTYRGWSRVQNSNLITWAKAHGRRQAAMLLYNTADPPFTSPPGRSALFNGCCSTTICHGWRWPTWGLPDGRSPLAASLVPDITNPAVAGLANPTPARVASVAMPFECIFCPVARRRRRPSLVTGRLPAWARVLVDAAAEFEPDRDQFAGLDQAGEIDDDLPGMDPADIHDDAAADTAAFSLVLGMSPNERDVYESEEV